MTKEERLLNIRTLLENVELNMLNPGYIDENGELLNQDLQEKWIKKSINDEMIKTLLQ